MLAIQTVGRSDNFAPKTKTRRRLRHLVTRTGRRELLLSKLMRPVEAIVLLISPVFFVAEQARRLRRRLAAARAGRDHARRRSIPARSAPPNNQMSPE